MSKKIEIISWEELEKKYPKENERQSKTMSYGEKNGRQMYLDYGDSKLKEEVKQINNLAFHLHKIITGIHNQCWNNGRIIPIDNIPKEYDSMFMDAVDYKRNGDYFMSLITYEKILENCGVCAELIKGIYKTMVAAGELAPAFEIMNVALISAHQNQNQNCILEYNSHLNELINRSNDENQLIAYMGIVSGNPNNYENIFPYEYLKQQLIDVVRKYQ